MKTRFAAVLCVLALPAAAQAQGVAATKPLYESIKGNLIKSAEQMPEAKYAFKPAPTVRSYGELIGHVADANYMFCALAKGEKSPAPGSFEKTVKDKAGLVKGLKDAFAYCDPVYTMPDASFADVAEMFGMKMTKLGWLILNVAHDNEHYGNIVTYLRINGLVPPSSQGGGM